MTALLTSFAAEHIQSANHS